MQHAASGGGDGGGATLPQPGQQPALQSERGQLPPVEGVAPATAALLARSGGKHAAAEERSLECRRFEVAGVGIDIRQDTRGSNALRPLDDDRACQGDAAGADEAAPPILTAEDLSRVGLVVWQAGFVLADLLLRKPPFGSWHGNQVLDLGCGTGLVGILLALAGAEVTLSDQPHIVPLAEANVRANLVPGLHRARVVGYTWGQGDAAAALLPPHPQPAVQDQQERGLAVGEGAVTEEQQQQQQPAAAATAAVEQRGPQQQAQGPQQQPPSRQTGQQQQQQQQQQRPLQPLHAAATPSPRPPPAPCFDVITAADVVYQPEAYAELATTLRTLAAPHTLVYLAFKRRGLQEGSLLQRLESLGFALAEVPGQQLAEEYREGAYRVVRACRIE